MILTGDNFALAMRTGLVSLVILGVQLLFTYVPAMNRLFHTAPIGAESWLRILGVAAVVFLIVELEKWLRYGRGRGEPALPEKTHLPL